MHVVYGSWFSWRYESLLRFGIGGPRIFLRVAATTIPQHFVKPGIMCTIEYYRKYEVKMTCILFKFIIYPSCERALKNGRVKLRSSLNLIFGQGSCLISDFARPNSNKAVLVQVFLRVEIVIFNNNFVFCMMSSFCIMGRVAGWILAREIIKRKNVFYPVCLKIYWINICDR